MNPAAEHARDDMLHFARMLGRRIDQHGAVFAGHCKRHLAFQIKVFLTADADRARAAQRCRGDGLARIAVDKGIVRQARTSPAALPCSTVTFGVLRVDLDRAATVPRAARRRARSQRTANTGWLMEIDAVVRKDRFIGQSPAKYRFCPECRPP